MKSIRNPNDEQISAWLGYHFDEKGRDFFTPEDLVEEIDRIGIEEWHDDWPDIDDESLRGDRTRALINTFEVCTTYIINETGRAVARKLYDDEARQQRRKRKGG